MAQVTLRSELPFSNIFVGSIAEADALFLREVSSGPILLCVLVGRMSMPGQMATACWAFAVSLLPSSEISSTAKISFPFESKIGRFGILAVPKPHLYAIPGPALSMFRNFASSLGTELRVLKGAWRYRNSLRLYNPKRVSFGLRESVEHCELFRTSSPSILDELEAAARRLLRVEEFKLLVVEARSGVNFVVFPFLFEYIAEEFPEDKAVGGLFASSAFSSLVGVRTLLRDSGGAGDATMGSDICDSSKVMSLICLTCD